MIPASYLFKDAYRQHWGKDFERTGKETPAVERGRLPTWPTPSVLRTALDLFDLAFGPRHRVAGAARR